MNEIMKIFFIFITIIPILMIVLILFFIINTNETKKFINKFNLIMLGCIVILATTLIWYYYPNDNLMKNMSIDDVYIRDDSISYHITDTNELNQLLHALNQNTYSRSASLSLVDKGFPSENLFILSLIDVKPNDINIIGFYVTCEDENSSQKGYTLEKVNVVQINEQFYKIKDSESFNQNVCQVIHTIQSNNQSNQSQLK